MTTTDSDSGAATDIQGPQRIGVAGFILLGLFGVLLPAFTLGYELWQGLCNAMLFDPVPTPLHVLLVALVPLANGIALFRLRTGRAIGDGWLMTLTAVAAGVTFYYALIFLPLTPASVLAIVVFGLGLLSLAPLLSLLIGLYLRHRLRRLPGLRPGLPAWLAVLMMPLLLSGVTAFDTLALHGMQMAVDPDPVKQARGVQWVRGFASDERLLRNCLAEPSSSGYLGVGRDYLLNPLGAVYRLSTVRLSAGQRRQVYYRVSGESCAAVPAEALAPLRRQPFGFGGAMDAALGQDRIGTRQAGLQLQQSQMHTRIRPRTATSYTEWVLVFRNDGFRIAEARVQLALPPGAVVSRLTLKIKGEEQEAAYARRKKVVQAYKRVVERRRDPVLVTTSGPERVLVQAFPVPPGGGTMKVRLGITAPLVARSRAQGVLRLPRLQQTNFDVPDTFVHSLTIDAPSVLAEPANAGHMNPTGEPGADGRHRLERQLDDSRLRRGWSVAVGLDPADATVRVHDLGVVATAGVERVIEQRLVEDASPRPRHLVLVIDGSRSMADVAAVLADALGGLPEGIELSLLLAGDRVTTPMVRRRVDTATIAELRDLVLTLPFVGGSDNRPALLQALDLAGSDDGRVVWWLHGDQPVTLGGPESLLTRLDGRGKGHVRLLALALTAGPNRLADALQGQTGFSRLAAVSGPGTDIRDQLARWRGERPALEFQRYARQPGPDDELRRDDDVARLWALGRVRQLAASGRSGDHQRAVELASEYQLVTRVSGAVVLENAGQYREAGLKQVDPRAPVTVSLPASWALMLLSGLLLAGAGAVRRRATRATTV